MQVGFFDLIIFAKNSKHEVLLLEMKREIGGVLSNEQKHWIEIFDKDDYCVAVAKGHEHAIYILEKYLTM